MNEKEYSTPTPQESADHLRDNLGLPKTATSEEVFAELRQRHNLPDDATNKEVILAMLTKFATELNECNDQLNKLAARRSLLGRIATFFSFKK